MKYLTRLAELICDEIFDVIRRVAKQILEEFQGSRLQKKKIGGGVERLKRQLRGNKHILKPDKRRKN